ncbi:MarR family winged helix-turn-helix transcriptional regulator [Cupriavidus nantongensis]|uniref:MarR family transcriptional regulator n=1 Tax=Cupriavidus nantongensis TaxID=1796606 RepID=A0A142JVA4_9BURK|nr:MarR family transcriptional regulator [Cupriavidus nantongensis]AMR82016.1 MarR family transcriptional regulator [Cupriavidus nantongensis]
MRRQTMKAPRAQTAEKTREGSPSKAQRSAALPSRLPYLIGRTDRIVKRRLGELLAPHGLTLPQFTALSVLHARGPTSNAQLAERSLISPQSANEVVKTMEARGWIVRQPDPLHGRIVLLSLTESARNLLRQCDDTVAAMEREMLEGIDAAHAVMLHELLQKCARNLR